jgi:hypothetical protein
LQYTILVLSGVQLQPDLGHPLLQGAKHLAGLLLRRAVHHRVIGVALELDGRELPLQPRGLSG